MRRDTARSPPRELPTGQGWPPCLQFCFALSTEPSRASSHARPSARTATAESSRTSSRARPQPATVGLDDHVLSAPPERAFAVNQQSESPRNRPTGGRDRASREQQPLTPLRSRSNRDRTFAHERRQQTYTGRSRSNCNRAFADNKPYETQRADPM